MEVTSQRIVKQHFYVRKIKNKCFLLSILYIFYIYSIYQTTTNNNNNRSQLRIRSIIDLSLGNMDDFNLIPGMCEGFGPRF